MHHSVGDVDNEGGCTCVGAGSIYAYSSVNFPLKFAVDLKLL